MSVCEWIVCEQSSRWAAALRREFARDAQSDGFQHRLREVRSLIELSESLAGLPADLAAIEVHHANLSNALTWLTAEGRRSGQTRFVAMLDRALQFGPWEAVHSSAAQQDVVAALREAGAIDTVVSPRHLGSLVDLGRRYGTSISRRCVPDDVKLSFTSKAWASLPWQVR